MCNAEHPQDTAMADFPTSRIAVVLAVSHLDDALISTVETSVAASGVPAVCFALGCSYVFASEHRS